MENKRKCRKYTGEEKVAAVEAMLAEGLSYGETARRFHVSCARLVKIWEEIYRAQGADELKKDHRTDRPQKGSYVPKKPARDMTEKELQAENELLRAQVAYLKKWLALAPQREELRKKHK